MKKEKTKSPSKAVQREDDCWINVHSDNEMMKYGVYRAGEYLGRDESVWKRTPHERRILKNITKPRKIYPFNTKPHKIIPVRGKLIIMLNKNKKFSKPTYSIECWQHEIPDLLMKYYRTDKNKKVISLVNKYSFLGRTYSPNELPFWN